MLRHSALVAVFALAAAGCGGGDSKPANVLLITLDTTRTDALGCYGAGSRATPVLDALAQESLRYSNAHTVAPLTAPAHASMLTGLVPPAHTVRGNGLGPLPKSATSVAELARDEGLASAAFVSSSVLDASFGLDQGFAPYDAPPRAPQASSSHFSERHAVATARAALKWLRSRQSDKRFFLWVHFFDPHVPYAAPEAFVAAVNGDAYLAEVAYVDQAVGELVAALRESGELARTLVVVVADHGEALGEHGEPTHGTFCYEPTLRVPLIVRYPDGYRAGESSDELVSVADVAPTIADALDLGTAEADGISLYRRDVPSDRAVYFESYSGFLDHGWGPLAGCIVGTEKYVASSAPELFDLAADPRETRNLLPAREGERGRFEARIAQLTARPALASDDWQPIDADLARELRQLGYASAGSQPLELPPPLARLDLPSPTDRSAELHAFLQATALIEQRAFADAAAILDALVQANPRDALALDELAFARMQLGEFEPARSALERRLALDTGRPETHLNLAACLEALDQRPAALAHARAALAMDPGSSAARQLVERLSAK